jgi:hypothetical protein
MQGANDVAAVFEILPDLSLPSNTPTAMPLHGADAGHPALELSPPSQLSRCAACAGKAKRS